VSETRLWRAPAAGPGRPALGGRLLVVGGLIVGATTTSAIAATTRLRDALRSLDEAERAAAAAEEAGVSIRHFRICFVCLGNICRSPTIGRPPRRARGIPMDGTECLGLLEHLSAGTVARA